MIVQDSIKNHEPIEAYSAAYKDHLRFLLPIYKKVHTTFNEYWNELKIESNKMEDLYEAVIQKLSEKFVITICDVEDILVGDPFDCLGEEFWNYKWED